MNMSTRLVLATTCSNPITALKHISTEEILSHIRYLDNKILHLEIDIHDRQATLEEIAGLTEEFIIECEDR